MAKYKKILWATDLSEASEKHLAYVKEVLSDNPDALAHLAHVVEHTPAAYGGEFSILLDLELEQQIEKKARHRLEQLGKHLAVNAEGCFLLEGSVAQEVTELAKKLEIDLLIVGRHSQHGFQLLMGSRANAIMHIAPCDILAVHLKSES